MKKLFIFSDESVFSSTARNVALSLGYEVDSYSFENQKLDATISNEILLRLKGQDLFIASDEMYFSMLRVNLMRVFSLSDAFNLVNLIDMSASISEKVSLGKNIFVGKNAVLSENVIIEDGVIISESAVILPNVFLSKGAFIGPKSVIGPNARLGSSSVIGSEVEIKSIMVGSKCKILNRGSYNENIPAHTSYIENHAQPVIYVENILI
ncbi:hypothetical protein [Polynucleobacter sp. AP-Feld-500C-C5]|uniref:hypothetical protein n=1 Tax=Polynucleobacter sp. AP-Feld-500C-C5 TaxID=2576924 RepID=UPI001C0BC0AD|nr:hypothetical protein [Polynucleobacter sp. AP-Feld-500C-C5]MBU3633157.1 hypothetical protein [Polynucleobacter sp. AP-Feld-500C-C5]